MLRKLEGKGKDDGKHSGRGNIQEGVLV